MWSSITNVLKKDLGEFASVLTTDTKRLIGDSDADIVVVAGDEATELGRQQPLEREVLAEFQRLETTYKEVLTGAEKKQIDAMLVNRFNGWQGLDEPLLSSSPIVAAMFKDLVQARQLVSHSDFFDRYFFRLQLLRLQRGSTCAVSHSSSTQPPPQHSRQDHNDEDLDAWDDVGAPPPEEGGNVKQDLSAAPRGVSPTTEACVVTVPKSVGEKLEEAGDETESSATVASSRIKDLERLVSALQAQVEGLQCENERLIEEKQTLVQIIDDLRAHQSSRSPAGTKESPTTAREPQPTRLDEPKEAEDDDDDDWGKLM